MTKTMKKIAETARTSRVKLRCSETNDVAPMQTWARKIARQRGAHQTSVAGALGLASKHGYEYLGLHWERV